MKKEIKAALSLNKSQSIEIFRETSERLETLSKLLLEAGITSQDPLNRRFIGSELFEALYADPLDEERLLPLLQRAKALTDQEQARRDRREARLRELGFEEISFEDRQRNLLAFDLYKP